MALPATISVSFDFNSSATFGYPFTIGDEKFGKLGGVGTLASSSVPIPVVDLSDQVRQISIRRGRNIMRDTYEAGSCTVRVTDTDGSWNPQNVNSIYYPYLTPMRKLRVSATTATTSQFLFSGYVESYKYTYPQSSTELGYVDIICSDAFRLMQLASVTTVTGGTLGQDTGARIGKILDMMQWPSNMRTIDSGNSTCIADPGYSRAGLEAIKNAEFSEQGAAYISAEGNFIFKNRTNVIKAAGDTPIEFNSTTGIPFKSLTYAFDDKLIVNSSDMTRYGGVKQSAYNNDSITKYFPHQSNQSNLVVQTDADALNIAKIYVATRAETSIRIDSMAIDLLDPNVPTDTILGIDYFTQLKITSTQPDGSLIVKTLQAQGVNWDITPNKLTAVFTTLEPIIEGFVIGSAVSGIIGQSIMAYQENKLATGFPFSTGDVLSAAAANGFVNFTLNDQTGTSYTPVLTDQYQVLITRSNASASTLTIPTNASVAFPVGTVITVLNKGAGAVTISGSGGVTVLSAGATAASPVLNQYKSCALIQTSANNWYVVGAIA